MSSAQAKPFSQRLSYEKKQWKYSLCPAFSGFGRCETKLILDFIHKPSFWVPTVTSTHPRGFSSRLAGEPTISPSVQNIWPRKSYRRRGGGDQVQDAVRAYNIPRIHFCYRNDVEGKDVRLVQGTSGKDDGHVYNRAQRVTESTRHKYNTSNTDGITNGRKGWRVMSTVRECFTCTVM